MANEVTKQHLEALETRLNARLSELRNDTNTRFDQVNARFDQMVEQMRDMQTELLKAFVPWQEGTQLRLREIEVNGHNTEGILKQRMEVLERRLGEIEKKLRIDPPAA